MPLPEDKAQIRVPLVPVALARWAKTPPTKTLQSHHLMSINRLDLHDAHCCLFSRVCLKQKLFAIVSGLYTKKFYLMMKFIAIFNSKLM